MRAGPAKLTHGRRDGRRRGPSAGSRQLLQTLSSNVIMLKARYGKVLHKHDCLTSHITATPYGVPVIPTALHALPRCHHCSCWQTRFRHCKRVLVSRGVSTESDPQGIVSSATSLLASSKQGSVSDAQSIAVSDAPGSASSLSASARKPVSIFPLDAVSPPPPVVLLHLREKCSKQARPWR